MEEPSSETMFGGLIGKSARYLKILLGRNSKEVGLKVSSEQLSAMMCIRRSPGLTRMQISEHAVKDKLGVARILKWVENRGYIRCTSEIRIDAYTEFPLLEDGEEILGRSIPIASAPE